MAKSVDGGQLAEPSRAPAAMARADRVLGGVLERAGQPEQPRRDRRRRPAPRRPAASARW